MSNETAAVVHNAIEARGLLRDVLRHLQELALLAADSQRRSLLLSIVETVAAASETLYQLETQGLGAAETVAHVDQALGQLREAMLLVQAPTLGEPIVERCGESIAQALAVLYAGGRSLQRASGAPCSSMSQLASSTPRRGSSTPRKRANAMMPIDGQHAQEAATLKALADRIPALSEPPRSMPVLGARGESRASQAAPSAREPSRRSRRASERVLIEVDVGFVSESNFYAGLSMDVSSGGFSSRPIEHFPFTRWYRFRLFYPRGMRLRLEGL